MKQLTDDQLAELRRQARDSDQLAERYWQWIFADLVIDEFCRINGITGEAQPALEWVGLTNQRTRELITDYFDAYWAINKATGLLEQFESELREKNAGQPAAYEGSDRQRLDDLVHALTGDEGEDDSFKVLERVVAELNGRTVRDLLAEDKAGGEVAGYISEGALKDMSRGDRHANIWFTRDQYNTVPLYTNPQPQAEAVSPDKAKNFYLAVCNFLVWIGREGTVRADDPIIDQLSNALHDIDGGVFKDNLKWPQDDLPAILKKQAS